jgi:hypothetical protein
MGRKSVSTRTEVTADEGVSGEEVLGLFGRFEPLHLPLLSSRRSMRVLGPIVQISALSVLDAAKQLTLSDAMAPQRVGHDHPGYILQTLQKLLAEALRGVGIAPGLNEDVEHNALPIDGTPEILLHASDSDEDLVHVPLVPWPWRRRRKRSEKLAPNFLHQRHTVSWETTTPRSARSSSTCGKLRLNTR